MAITSSELDLMLKRLKEEDRPKIKPEKKTKVTVKPKMIKYKKDYLNLYGLYRKNKLVATGTAKEIATQEGLQVGTIYSYLFNRNTKTSKDKNVRLEILDKKEYEINLKINKIIKLYNMGFGIKEVINLVGGISYGN